MYTSEVLAQFQNQRYVGELHEADATAQIENPACGDILRLSLKISDDVITNARFRARGCVAAIASGSKLCEMLVGKSVNEARTLGREQLVDALGGLPETSSHAGHLALD